MNSEDKISEIIEEVIKKADFLNLVSNFRSHAVFEFNIDEQSPKCDKKSEIADKGTLVLAVIKSLKGREYIENFSLGPFDLEENFSKKYS